MEGFHVSDLQELTATEVSIPEIPATVVNEAYAESVIFWSEELARVADFGGEYTSYADRLNQTPREDDDRGHYEGERGESTYIPSDSTEAGEKAIEKLAEYGLDGIEYINAEPDFSECAEATVKVGHMTQNRQDCVDENGQYTYGNFSQADMKCAEQWNAEGKDGRSDWAARDVSDYRKENHLSWHERCDTETMDLVPQEIHSYFTHSGGVAECKARDAKEQTIGGEFDA